MKKSSIGILAGLVCAGGGVGYLFEQGYQVLSLQTWTYSVQIFLSNPLSLFESASSGLDADLFRGILIVLCGISFSICLAVVTVIMSLTGSVLSSRKKGAKGKNRSVSAEVVEPGPERTERKGPRIQFLKLPKIGLKLSSLRKDKASFTDKVADLGDREGAEEKDSLWSKIRRKLEAKFTSRKNHLVVKTGKSVETVIEVSHDDDFIADLNRWCRDIRKLSPESREGVLRAKALRERETKAVRNMVMDQDPMGGEFKLKLLKAWAEKDIGEGNALPSSDEIIRSGGDSAFAEAIEEVARNGVVYDGDEDEVVIDLEASGSLNLDDLFKAEVHKDVALDTSEVLISDEEDEAPDGENFAEEIKAIIGELISIKTEAKRVNLGQGYWEGDFEDEDRRLEVVDSAFARLGEVIEQETVGGIIEKLDPIEDRREIDWFEEYAGSLSAEHDDLALAVRDKRNGDSTDEDSDLDQLYSMAGAIVAAGEGEEDEPDEVIPEGQDGQVLFAEEVGESHPEPVIDAPSIAAPGDLTANQLEEVELSGELLFQWGQVARTAGATQAKIAHILTNKVGVSRKVMGVVHLVSVWKSLGEEEPARLNVIFRHVPAGQWHLDLSDGVKILDDRDNYVQVDDQILMHPEVEGSKLIVHFHGEGAPVGLLEQKGNVMVTSDLLAVEKVRSLMAS